MVNFKIINYQLCGAALITAAAYISTRNFQSSVGIAASSAFLAHLALKNFAPSRSFIAENLAREPEDIYERKYEEGELEEEENTPDATATHEKMASSSERIEVGSEARPYRTSLSPETFKYIGQLVKEIRTKHGLPLRGPIQSEILPSVSEEKGSASEDNYAELENLPEYLRETDSPSGSLVDEIYDTEEVPRLLEAAYYADLD